MFDPMSDLADAAISEDPLARGGFSGSSQPAQRREPRQNRGEGGSYANEIHSVRISARQRTFYLDLKESSQGKFFKLSEKSRGGRKVTIMFDVEDLPKFMAAFTEMQGKI